MFLNSETCPELTTWPPRPLCPQSLHHNPNYLPNSIPQVQLPGQILGPTLPCQERCAPSPAAQISVSRLVWFPDLCCLSPLSCSLTPLCCIRGASRLSAKCECWARSGGQRRGNQGSLPTFGSSILSPSSLLFLSPTPSLSSLSPFWRTFSSHVFPECALHSTLSSPRGPLEC